MSWFELPHPDNLSIGLERMHPRTRWLLTIFIFVTLLLCWYITAYRPLQQRLQGYKLSIELMKQHAEQLPLLQQQIARAQSRLQETEVQLGKVNIVQSRQAQPCIWVYEVAQQHELLISQCALGAARGSDAVSIAGKGSLGALQEFMQALHGLHTGWAFESFNVQKSSRGEEDVQLFAFNGILAPIRCGDTY